MKGNLANVPALRFWTEMGFTEIVLHYEHERACVVLRNEPPEQGSNRRYP